MLADPCAAARCAGSERLIGKTSSGSLQDILRLLTLWFNYGHAPDVEAALQEGFAHVSIDTWLAVIPQVGSSKGWGWAGGGKPGARTCVHVR